MNQFYGKYRGVVTDNMDPLMMGRIRAKVPGVLGDKYSSWALPCTPYAGPGVGLLLIPPINASVWIEFEQGNPDNPVWTGCYWAKGEVPGPADPEKKMLKTNMGTIIFDDTQSSGGIIIKTNDDVMIALTDSGIEINDGQRGNVKLSGPKVTINDRLTKRRK